jgi:quercetin dioxygenase-like cupin family protein
MSGTQPVAKNKYVIDLHSMGKAPTLGKVSTGEGASFQGERIYCGVVTKKRGTGSKPHYHPDETFNYVLKGALKVNMDGEEFVVPTGCLLHIPANMVHTAVATDDRDAVYLVWRDRLNEKAGKPVTIEVAAGKA